MRKLFSENWFTVAVAIIGLALVLSLILTIRNNAIIKQNNALVKQTELVKQRTEEILTGTMHGLDLGVRGFGLTKDEALLNPYNIALENNSRRFKEVEDFLAIQGYNDSSRFSALKLEVDDYILFSKKMVELARVDSMTLFKKMLGEDKGFGVWIKYSKFIEPLFAYQDNRNKQALASYEAAMQNNIILQGAIILLSLPVLIFIVFRIRKERKSRQALVKQVKENDLKHVFNAGESEQQSDNAILNTIIENAREASSFVKSMAQNNYEVQWKGLTEKNLSINKDTLAGNLVYMRENLKKIKEEDQKRNWMNEGLTQFSSLVRNYQHDPKVLADQCISFLTTHLHSQQGSLFVLEEEEGNAYLTLASCYAFNKKKIKEGRVELGDGLVGQTFLEGETTILNQIPEGYIKITSGLGDATPRHVVIVPLKYDTQTLAIVELASFSPYEPHHVSFIEKSGEFLASAVLTAQTTSKMKALLDQAKITEEQMRQREEEMRQNMEELQATQEELVRKEKEMQRQLAGKV